MKTRVIIGALALALAFAVAARADVQSIPVVRISVEADLPAPPAAVWAQLTQGKNFVTWCSVWKNARNASVNLTKVGDVLDFTDDWGNGGRSVVTYLEANKELRVAHEPNDGSYLCQGRLILTPQAAGTHVRYTEQYTDESKDADRQATSQKMMAEMQSALDVLKKNLAR